MHPATGCTRKIVIVLLRQRSRNLAQAPGLLNDDRAVAMVVEGVRVTLDRAEGQGDLLVSMGPVFRAGVGEDLVYALLHRERDQLVPDDFFGDVFTDPG